MLKEVLKSIADGNSTIVNISKSTQLEESAVIHAVDELKKMGYLEGTICSMDKPMCRNCPMAKGKPSTGANLCMTKKGFRYTKRNANI